jgi:phosphoadenosine phosphosulfate reductase
MLLQSNRFLDNDLETWNKWVKNDEIHIKSKGYKFRLNKTIERIKKFADENDENTYYVGVSWGKDSIVLSHMIYNIGVSPINIYIRQLDNENPHNKDVRDNFLKLFNINYYEESYSYKTTPDQTYFKNGKPNKWYYILNQLNKKYNKRITGLRKDESAKRKFRFDVFGDESLNSFTPFENFLVADIFGYMYENNLPIHPNYAMTINGLIDRNRLRVAAIGNNEGDGMFRKLWEKTYYQDILNRNAKGYDYDL